MFNAAAAWTREPASKMACKVSICLKDKLRMRTTHSIFLKARPKISQFLLFCKDPYLTPQPPIDPVGARATLGGARE